MSALDLSMVILFWICIAIIAYSYAGLPVFVFLRGLLARRPVKLSDSHPSITVCIAAHNEEAVIREKLGNTLACIYPDERMQVIVASDGSTDQTEAIVSAYGDERVELLTLPRVGKNEALNQAVAHAKHDVLVFTDADVTLQPDALEQLAAPFGDEHVGCVAGDFRYGGGDEANLGEHAHWNLDRWMKIQMSRSGSITSGTGQLLALRKACFTEVPRGVTDDFFISVQAVRHHQRIYFQPEAHCSGKGVPSTQNEFARKVRIMTAGLKGVWEVRDLCNPFKHGFYSIQLFSHKVARRLSAIPYVLQLLILCYLAGLCPFYLALLAVQIPIHVLATLGYVLRNTAVGKTKLFVLPYFFDMVLLSTFVALYKLMADHKQDLWSPQRGDS